VLRISLPWIISVVDKLKQLEAIEPNTGIADAFFDLADVQYHVKVVFDQSVYAEHLRASRSKADELHALLQEFMNKFDAEPNYRLNQYDIFQIKNKKNEFATIFNAELNIMPSFIVTGKEGFDVNLLIDRGVVLFPPSMISKVPETKLDAIEVGRALAFEIATGCGFHVFRIVESVVRRYWDVVSSNTARPKPQTIGSFALELENKSFGDAKVWESLKQLTRLHRNPLIHPDVILTVEEVIGVIGISRSVIVAMLSVLPESPVTTGAVLPPTLP
jgi:hypothetical protein